MKKAFTFGYYKSKTNPPLPGQPGMSGLGPIMLDLSFYLHIENEFITSQITTTMKSKQPNAQNLSFSNTFMLNPTVNFCPFFALVICHIPTKVSCSPFSISMKLHPVSKLVCTVKLALRYYIWVWSNLIIMASSSSMFHLYSWLWR